MRSPIGTNLTKSGTSGGITGCDAFLWRKPSKITVQYDPGKIVILHVLYVENVDSFIF